MRPVSFLREQEHLALAVRPETKQLRQLTGTATPSVVIPRKGIQLTASPLSLG